MEPGVPGRCLAGPVRVALLCGFERDYLTGYAHRGSCPGCPGDAEPRPEAVAMSQQPLAGAVERDAHGLCLTGFERVARGRDDDHLDPGPSTRDGRNRDELVPLEP